MSLLGDERIGKKAAKIDTPVALIDYSTLCRNIEDMAERARRTGVGLRPHTKTHKCAAIANLQLRAGASGITVAKLDEAEIMAQAGANDILIAYPIVQEAKILRLLALGKWVGRVACTVDSLEGAHRLSEVATESNRAPLDVLIEVDTGLHRIGLPPGRPTVEFARELAMLRGIRTRGILTHAGFGHSARTKEELIAIGRSEADHLPNRVDRPDFLVKPVIHGKRMGFAYEAIRDFVERIATGREMLATLEDGIKVSCVILAIMESAKRREPIEVKYL